jgi:Tfp pilus assembly protein FimT
LRQLGTGGTETLHASSRSADVFGREAGTRGARGFTLVEAVVGLALAAALAGIGTVRLVELVWRARLAGAARTVGTVLRLARGQAIAGNVPMEVRFDIARRACEMREQGGAQLERRALPAGVAFGALPARGRIVFGALGTAENGTITLASGGHVLSVVVNQRGRVRVQ